MLLVSAFPFITVAVAVANILFVNVYFTSIENNTKKIKYLEKNNKMDNIIILFHSSQFQMVLVHYFHQ